MCPDIQWNGKISSLQQDRHLRADPDDLPQGDDPRFESRVAYTGQANTNDKVKKCICKIHACIHSFTHSVEISKIVKIM